MKTTDFIYEVYIFFSILGVYYAFLDLNKAIKEKQVINFNKIIAYRESKSKDKPISLVVTKYHTLVLFNGTLKVSLKDFKKLNLNF